MVVQYTRTDTTSMMASCFRRTGRETEWFTSRTAGELYIISVTQGVYSISRPVQVVKQ